MERAINRRDLLVASAGTLTMMASLQGGSALAAEHGAHATTAGALVTAANACVAEGEACLAHCLGMFAAGDTSLAACASSVAEMLPACRAVSALATLGSKRLAAFLGPCIDVCTHCEEECRKHAEKHAVCRACAEACARFIAEAKKASAA